MFEIAVFTNRGHRPTGRDRYARFCFDLSEPGEQEPWVTLPEWRTESHPIAPGRSSSDGLDTARAHVLDAGDLTVAQADVPSSSAAHAISGYSEAASRKPRQPSLTLGTGSAPAGLAALLRFGTKRQLSMLAVA